VAGTTNFTAANVSTTFEALYLNGTSNEGVNNNQLGIASSIAAEFNQEFAITAADGESTLLVINDLNGNSAAVWGHYTKVT
jgi:hypothetical protein